MTDRIGDIDMKYTVTQVGRRWFKVTAEVTTHRNGCESIAVVADVEATSHFTYNNTLDYTFNIVGLGNRKYRDGIIEALNNFLAPKDMPF